MKPTSQKISGFFRGVIFWAVYVFLFYFVPHMAGCSSFVDLLLPAKIKGLYGVKLGESHFGDTHWTGSSTDPYGGICVSKLEKSKRVYEIEAIVRDKKLEEVLSLVKEKYGIEPKIKQFSNSGGNYYWFEDFRSPRAILVWKEEGRSVVIRAIDYSLKELVEKEKRELELEAL